MDRALVYNKDSLTVKREYSTLASAKAAITRKYGHKQYAAATVDDFYDNIDYPVVVKNLISGAEVTIRKSEQGTCVDPSTERYHAM